MPNEKTDWNAIRAEYIAGGIGQRRLAKKHGVPETTLVARAKAEKWAELREKAKNEIITKSLQKTATAAADNAAAAQRIKAKLLARLEKEIDTIPEESVGSLRYSQTERTDFDKKTGKPVRKRSGIEYRLRELAATYKDLTADLLPEQGRNNELLQSLLDLERRGDGGA